MGSNTSSLGVLVLGHVGCVRTLFVRVRRHLSCRVLIMCSLSGAHGHAIVNNVEYSEVEGFLQGAAEPLAANGESVYPGNTNQFLVKLGPYMQCLAATQGLVPEFVNPKYTDASRTAFASPTRLECMMQDLPRLFREAGYDAKVTHTH